MKKLARRHLQRQEHPPAKTGQPFFTRDSGQLQQTGTTPFFQTQAKQAKEGDKEEQAQTVSRAATEERQETVKRKGEEEKKENAPVMRQAAGPEDKDLPAKS